MIRAATPTRCICASRSVVHPAAGRIQTYVLREQAGAVRARSASLPLPLSSEGLPRHALEAGAGIASGGRGLVIRGKSRPIIGAGPAAGVAKRPAAGLAPSLYVMTGPASVIAVSVAQAAPDLTGGMVGRVHVHVRRARPDRIQDLGEADRAGVDSLVRARDDVGRG